MTRDFADDVAHELWSTTVGLVPTTFANRPDGLERFLRTPYSQTLRHLKELL